MFFKHFASKNQLPGFYISGALVKNGSTKHFRFSIKDTLNAFDNCKKNYEVMFFDM